MKNKKCKCSHLKSEHTKFTHLCNNCQCSDFNNATVKQSTHKIMVIYYISMCVTLTTLPFMLFFLVDTIPDEVMNQSFLILDEKSNITSVGQMYETIVILSFLLVVLFDLLYSIWIFDEIKAMRRKDWN